MLLAGCCGLTHGPRFYWVAWSAMSDLSSEQLRMLHTPFLRTNKSKEAIGVEIEAGLVDPITGISRPYYGLRGVAQFLRCVCERWAATPLYEGKDIIGLERSDGTAIGIESGCAIEYVSTAEQSLHSIVERANRDLRDLADIADNIDLALLSGSMLPFDTQEDVTWAPKRRIPFMLEHFNREVGSTSQGWAAMAQIITVQTTLDYLDADDLSCKHRTANVVSPLVAALFVNSPMQAGEVSQALSRRMQIWEEVDSRRVGLFEYSITSHFTLEHLIDWACSLPMIYRVVKDKIQAAPPYASFDSLLRAGFGDGTAPMLTDWKGMLSTTWPYVRVRDTLELRITDGPTKEHWAAVPALWVALIYDHQARDAAWDLAGGYPLKAYKEAINDVALRGLDATIEGRPIRPLCRELLNIARASLRRRVNQGLDSEEAVSYLDPVVEVIESGATFADNLKRQLLTGSGIAPKQYVEAYRYR
jgi:glutamate--cysteine ligase